MYGYIFGIFVFERVSGVVCRGESVFFCGFQWLCFSVRQSLIFSLDLLQRVVFLRFVVCAAKRPKTFALCLFFFLGSNLNTAEVKTKKEKETNNKCFWSFSCIDNKPQENNML